MKEYGGYFSLELSKGKEYYEGADIVRCNCARSAILLSIKDADLKKVWLPYYMCESVSKALLKNNVEVSYYHINKNMEPLDVDIKEEEGILIANYFGIKKKSKIDDICQQFRFVILDNTQSFFSAPAIGAYNIYSCRKFFGVSDGAYLIKKDIKPTPLKKDYSADRAVYLLKSMETGTNDNYKLSLKNEVEIETSEILQMSDLTEAILKSIQYEAVKEIRRKNFYYLHERIGKTNELEIGINDEVVPMVYPYLCRSKKLRTKLIQNHIYVPQWWVYLLNNPNINELERDLSEYLIPLPIDQRYNQNDMEAIYKIVIDCREEI